MKGELSRYLSEVGRYPLLTADEERDLARAYRDRGDTRAAHALVVSNLRFVVKMASAYHRPGLRLPDLIQEGNIGLMRAVQKFDPERGIRLVTYAAWWIRAHIRNHLIDSWSMVKVGTTQPQRRLFFSLSRARREAERWGAGEGADEHVASELRVSPDEVREMGQRLEGRDLSLDAPVGDGPTGRVELVPGGEIPADEALHEAHASSLVESGVKQALEALDERERVIVERRLMAESPATLQDLGAELGISRERTRQLESRALAKLRLSLRPLVEELGSEAA